MRQLEGTSALARFTALRMYADAMDNLLGRRHNEDRRATSSELRPQDECRVGGVADVLRPIRSFDVLDVDVQKSNSIQVRPMTLVNASMVTPRNWQAARMVLHESVICNFLRSNDLWQAG